MHIGKWICGALAAAAVAAPALGAPTRAALVVTLDARNYVTYAVASLSPAESVVRVLESGMENCHRAGGGSLQSGRWHLSRAVSSLAIDVETVRVEFNPTRLVLDSSTHDIVCDGQAMGWQTGIGRMFEDDFGDG